MQPIYVPTRGPEEWRLLLADPSKQWKTGFSARSLAHAWEDANGFPVDVQAVLRQAFPGIEPLIVLPEHQVPLPGGRAASQNDVWVLARTGKDIVSIAVEGKVSEGFGHPLAEWRAAASAGRLKRLQFLAELLGLARLPDGIRYQLLHRTASALIEASRFNAQHAVLLVHSFSSVNEGFQDFADFVTLFGAAARVDGIMTARDRNAPCLHFAWVHGDEEYLKR
jgi:hypothetical protein